MNKLNRKIFATLVSILSAFLVILIIIFNVSLYDTEKARSREMFRRVDYGEEFRGSPFENLPKDKDFLEANDKIMAEHIATALVLSLIIGLGVEVLIVYISRVIAKRISEPVEEAFAKQKQFVSDASHELKTPLAIIQASAESLENKPNEQKYLENIKSETVKMTSLVNDLLELSRTDGTSLKMVLKEINLSKLIEKKSLSFESLIFENKMTLETKIEPGIILKCDQDKIKELLSILLDNAIKYGESKSGIKVELAESKTEAFLNVTNKGKEIPLEEREKIFERFYRVDKSRNRKSGSFGLGLSIAKNIVENHNGNISVSCDKGYTTFKVVFKK